MSASSTALAHPTQPDKDTCQPDGQPLTDDGAVTPSSVAPPPAEAPVDALAAHPPHSAASGVERAVVGSSAATGQSDLANAAPASSASLFEVTAARSGPSVGASDGVGTAHAPTSMAEPKYPPQPIVIPELLEHILSFVAASVPPFHSSLLRVSAVWYAYLAPRLYEKVSFVRGKSIRRQRLMDALENRTLERLGETPIRHLALRINDPDRRDDLLFRLQGLCEASSTFARALETLKLNPKLCHESAIIQDGEDIALLLPCCTGLRQLVLRAANELLTTSLFSTLDDLGTSKSRRSVVRKLSIDLPAKALFLPAMEERCRVRVRTIRTFLKGDESFKGTRGSALVLCKIFDILLGVVDPLCDKLVLGRALVAIVGSSRRAADATTYNGSELFWGAAERLARERADRIGCRVIFPSGMGVAEVLETHPLYRQQGLEGVIKLWREGTRVSLVLSVAAAPLVQTNGSDADDDDSDY